MRAKTYAFEADPDSAASLRQQAVADFERAWMTLKLWEAAAESSETKAVQQLRAGIELLMNELDAMIMNGDASEPA